MLTEEVFILCVKTDSDSAIQTARGSLFHHLDARPEKSHDACLPFILRDDQAEPKLSPYVVIIKFDTQFTECISHKSSHLELLKKTLNTRFIHKFKF